MFPQVRYFSNTGKNTFTKLTNKFLQDKCYVNGNWVKAKNGNTFDIFNPANGNLLASVPNMVVEDVEEAVKAAAEAFKSWRLTTAKERARLLRQWFNLLETNNEVVAEIMTAESGKPLVESRNECMYGNSFVEWFSEEARRIDGEIIGSPMPSKKILSVREPIGVAALITPWNFPHAMITRKAGAALASGCTCVIKPSEDTPLTALAIAHFAHEAGIPKGVFNIVTTNRENAASVGKFLCESPSIAGLSFTGSTTVGKLLYKQCSAGVKNLSLELGGNAPFIVFPSANIKNAVSGAMASKFRNGGQTCIASNRFLVHEEISDSFVKGMVEEIKKLKIGDGFEPDVTIGPLINKSQINKVAGIVEDALNKGAKALIGGKAAQSQGELFYEPTVLVDLTDKMRVFSEEVFGPVVPIINFKSEEEAINVANSTQHGLAAYFYSQDLSQIFRVSSALESGMIGINEGIISTPEAPFGGVKESGLGREGSHHGINEYTQVKYLCLGGI